LGQVCFGASLVIEQRIAQADCRESNLKSIRTFAEKNQAIRAD